MHSDAELADAVIEIFNEECWHFTPEQDEAEIERLKRLVEQYYRAEREYHNERYGPPEEEDDDVPGE